MVAGYVSSSYQFGLLLCVSLSALYLGLNSFRKQVLAPIVFSNFLFKTPLTKILAMTWLAWFSYSSYFYLIRIEFYHSAFIFSWAYFFFVIADFCVKSLPIYLIYKMRCIDNDTIRA